MRTKGAKGSMAKESTFCLFCLFFAVVKIMMYAFGDVPNPRQDSAELLEDMVSNYIADVVMFSAFYFSKFIW